MKRFFYFTLAIVAFAGMLVTRLDSTEEERQRSAIATQPAQRSAFTPTIQPTSTIVPSVTVDYQSTVEIALNAANQAQATADAAMRLQIEATAAQDQRAHEEYMLEGEQERLALELELRALSGTQTAAPTAMAATATQQAWVIEAERARSTMHSAQITATAQAPRILREMKTAENYEYVIFGQVVAYVGIGFAGIGLVIFIVVKWRVENRRLLDKEQEERSKRWGPQATDGAGEVQGRAITFRDGEKLWKDTIPGTRELPITQEMLLELADGLLTGMTLAINNWEGADTAWTRETILLMRSFLRRNGLAVDTGNNTLRLTKQGEKLEGESFFRYISVRGEAPPYWMPGINLSELLGEKSHMSPAHDGGGGGEVVLDSEIIDMENGEEYEN